MMTPRVGILYCVLLYTGCRLSSRPHCTYYISYSPECQEFDVILKIV